MADSNVNVPDQPGYRGDPIAHRLPTERDADMNGFVFSSQAWWRLHQTADLPCVRYTEVLSGESWYPLFSFDRRPDPISISAHNRTAALGMTPQQVNTIRQKLEEIAKTIPPDFFVQEIINSELCGLVSLNWEVALKRLQEGKL